MSDDGYEYEYDDFGGGLYDSEEEPSGLAEQVDALAEHTLYSPVLVNAHPDFELDWDEWEYLTDEYYDGEDKNVSQKEGVPKTEQSKSGKRKRVAEDQHDVSENSKRRKVNGTQQKVPPSLVVWRNKDNRSNIPPVKSDDGKKIVLLPNWREFIPMSENPIPHESASESDVEARDGHEAQSPKIESNNTAPRSTDRKPERRKTGRQKENVLSQVDNVKAMSGSLDSKTSKPLSKSKAKAR